MLSRVLSASLLLLATAAEAEPLLLSGEVAARNSQVFVAPEANNWMVQIAWMIEEGERVKAGDPVVQYDTASVAANLEQLEATLRKVTAESRRNDLIQDLALREAEHAYRIAKLNLQRAQLDAGIPRELLSELQYEQYQLARTRALNAQVETEKALLVKQLDVAAEKTRNQVEIAGANNELQRVQLILDNMTQRTDRAGTALYVEHPWTGQKVREGDSIQRGFNVLEIPSTDDLHIRAWLNEVDVARVAEQQQVEIRFDSKPDLILTGVVERIGNQAEPKEHWGDSGYINIDIRFVTPPATELLPGMSVLVAVQEADA